MNITPTQFLQDYPEFDSSKVTDPDAVQFSPSQVTYYLNLAILLVQGTGRWDDTATNPPTTTQLELGVELFIAHHLVLEAVSMRGSKAGGIPGLAKGVMISQGSGDTQVSYDSNSVLELDAGHWNYTLYGKRFIHLARFVGAGPVQVGPSGCAGPGSWPGPWPWNFPNQSG